MTRFSALFCMFYLFFGHQAMSMYSSVTNEKKLSDAISESVIRVLNETKLRPIGKEKHVEQLHQHLLNLIVAVLDTSPAEKRSKYFLLYYTIIRKFIGDFPGNNEFLNWTGLPLSAPLGAADPRAALRWLQKEASNYSVKQDQFARAARHYVGVKRLIPWLNKFLEFAPENLVVQLNSLEMDRLMQGLHFVPGEFFGRTNMTLSHQTNLAAKALAFSFDLALWNAMIRDKTEVAGILMSYEDEALLSPEHMEAFRTYLEEEKQKIKADPRLSNASLETHLKIMLILLR